MGLHGAYMGPIWGLDGAKWSLYGAYMGLHGAKWSLHGAYMGQNMAYTGPKARTTRSATSSTAGACASGLTCCTA